MALPTNQASTAGGKRTWGGLVGIGGYRLLLDGGGVRSGRSTCLDIRHLDRVWSDDYSCLF